MAPPGVTVHTSRMPFLPDRYEKPLDEMERHVARVLEEAASAEPDVIAYGCTASSAKGDPDEYKSRLETEGGTPTETAAGALLSALAALGARRIVLVTPYAPEENAHEAEYFTENGIDVLADDSVIVDEGQYRMRYMSRVPTDPLVERAVALANAHEPDAVVLACCDMPTLEAIPLIEAATGRPAISSAQALFWASSRRAGMNEPTPGRGRLLAEF